MNKAVATLGALALTVALAQGAKTELVGFALLEADTFAEGPASGQFTSSGGKLETPRFRSQPVQGFSGIQFGENGSYWVLPDNGFGAKYNSADYLLRLYNITLEPKTAQGGAGAVKINRFVSLRDPDKKVPFPIANEASSERLLTGFDFDVESFVLVGNELWIGDEFGPYLLRFDNTGKLLEAPMATPDFGAGKDPAKDFVRSPQHPSVLASSPQPGQPSGANIASSGGYEGMAANPAKTKLYALLEKSVVPETGILRLNEFDVATRKFTGLKGYYKLEDVANAIGDVATVNDNEYLVIERDNGSGATAKFKRVYKIDIGKKDAQNVFSKELVADLMNIADSSRLAPSTQNGVFTFPFVTIEDVVVLNATTILVANDNNYDGKGGRGADVKDPNEFIWLKLEKPLTLGTGIGGR
jgi:hypothetical protein